METYTPGDYLTMPDPFAPALLPARDATRTRTELGPQAPNPTLTTADRNP